MNSSFVGLMGEREKEICQTRKRREKKIKFQNRKTHSMAGTVGD